MFKTTTLVLPYTASSAKKFRDLRHVELSFRVRGSRIRFVRISINGIYRDGHHASLKANRYANPGWTFGPMHWVHFRRHCWHLGIDVGHRGITLSYGIKSI